MLLKLYCQQFYMQHDDLRNLECKNKQKYPVKILFVYIPAHICSL